MLTIQKSVYLTVYFSIAFYSCVPAAVYRNADVATTENARVIHDPVNKPLAYRNDIPIRAERTLLTWYTDAEAINWRQTDNKGWTVSFRTGQVKTTMEFDLDGICSHIYNFYSQTPAGIKKIITQNFDGYQINAVYESIFPAEQYKSIFAVEIKRADNCKIIQLDKGAMTIFSDFELISPGADNIAK
jgi:hypothetical protein